MESLTFWLLAVAMVVVALAFVLPGLLGRGRRAHATSRDELNAAVYRAELAEVAAQQSSGALAADDCERARAELARRLLDDVAPVPLHAASASPRGVGPAIAIGLPALAFGLYLALGSPGMVAAPGTEPDMPFRADGGANFRAQLAAHLANAPRDGRAWMALARLDMSEDRFDDAAAAYAKAIDASPKIARDPGALCEYADALGMAQGGRLEGRPAELIARALALDPAHPKALEMAGSAAYERRDYRGAAQYWRELLAQLAPGTPEHGELAAAVERAERLAATTLPDAPGASIPKG